MFYRNLQYLIFKKKKHILKGMVLSLALLFTYFYLSHIALNSPSFFVGHGVQIFTLPSSLILISLVFSIYSFFLTPIFNAFSRKNEFEADEYAVKMTSSDNLINGLLNLYKHNLGNITPDHLHSAFYDSHPPATVRINHINKVSSKCKP